MHYIFIYFVDYKKSNRLRVENETQYVKSRLQKSITINKSEIENANLHTRTEDMYRKKVA